MRKTLQREVILIPVLGCPSRGVRRHSICHPVALSWDGDPKRHIKSVAVGWLRASLLCLSNPLYFILFPEKSCFLWWYLWYCDFLIFFKCLSKRSSKQHGSVLDFSYLFMCVFIYMCMHICNEDNRSRLVDCYLHFQCTCIYFTFLCNDLLQMPVPQRNKSGAKVPFR